MSQIYQFKISLKGSKPPIWRRFLVPKKYTFLDFHVVIQKVMGWGNEHLFEFNTFMGTIGMSSEDIGDFDSDDEPDMIAKKVKLDKVFTEPKQKIQYVYDFGDGWEHTIELEKILPMDKDDYYPQCITGKMNCPPENCGGLYGFYDMLNVLKDDANPERDDLLEWLDEDYDPEEFDIDFINECLSGGNEDIYDI